MEHIKEQIKTGDVKGAAETLKKLLAAEPDNVEAQMLYGTCCHLLGDDETFKKIHDDLAPKMQNEKDEKKVSLWKKYQALWEYALAAGLILTAVAAGAWYFGKDVMNMYGVKYGGPAYYESQTVQRVSGELPDVAPVTQQDWRKQPSDSVVFE